MDYIDIIKKTSHIHCARGPNRCVKCKILQKQGDSFALLRVYLGPSDIARPMTEIHMGDRKIFGTYDVLKRFDQEKDAKEYSLINEIDIYLDSVSKEV